MTPCFYAMRKAVRCGTGSIERLGRIVGVNVNVFRSEIRRVEDNAVLSSAKFYPNLALRLRQRAVRFHLVELLHYSVPKYFLPRDPDFHLFDLNWYTAVTYCGQNTPPVGIGTCPCGFDQWRMGDGF